MKIIKPYFVIETEIDTEEVMKHLEKCGRTCYQSGDLSNEKSAERFIQAIVKSGHESVIEHFSITVRIITSRSVTHQLVRHRLASYSQESQRYCSYNKDKFNNGIVFIKPTWVDDAVLGEYDIKWNGIYGTDIDEIMKAVDKPTYRWFWACATSERDYLRLVEEGWVSERAREVLPNCCKTEIVVTANCREWRSIFKQRCDSHAQSEIRDIMQGIHKEFSEKLPAIFGDLTFK